jgi:hypothetical protein
VTLGRPRAAVQIRPPDAGAIAASQTVEAVDLADFYAGSTASRDVIRLSTRAAALVRAGLKIRALVIAGLAQTSRILRFSERLLILEYGIYREGCSAT